MGQVQPDIQVFIHILPFSANTTTRTQLSKKIKKYTLEDENKKNKNKKQKKIWARLRLVLDEKQKHFSKSAFAKIYRSCEAL